MSDFRRKTDEEKFCSSCGSIILAKAEICPKCGVRQIPAPGSNSGSGASQKMPWLYFIDAMEKYAVFGGRARRAEYWWFCLSLVVINIVVSMIFPNWIGNVVYLAFVVPQLAVSWRRMHDVGKSGWYCFIPIYSIILAVTAGFPGSNQYGPDPKEEQV
jgi:uncharacterized membrane protein YhaH (DUF805 family)